MILRDASGPVVSRLARVSETVAEAAMRAGRAPDDVTIVAVSKGFGPEAIREVLAAGQIDFGENRAQEAASKFEVLGSEGIRWHFVGRLQRNKVRLLVPFVSVVHSVDRIELASEISRRARGRQQVLLEVATGGEPGKGGVAPDRLIELAEEIASMDRIELAGLMTMAPVVADPEHARPYFRRLAQLMEALRERFPDAAHIQHLSMGMSQDYAVAVEEGSTMVRVGEAIFGPRRH